MDKINFSKREESNHRTIIFDDYKLNKIQFYHILPKHLDIYLIGYIRTEPVVGAACAGATHYYLNGKKEKYRLLGNKIWRERRMGWL